MPDALLLGDLLARSAKLHDHLCPRQVLGIRMGMYAADLLDLDLPQSDKRLLTIVETDGCFADGVSVSTGCWIGRRTLRHVDLGKVAATFVDTESGRAIRLHPSSDARRLAPIHAPSALDRWHAYLQGYQVIPAPDLLVREDVALATPVETLISNPTSKSICVGCGEEIFNQREVTVAEQTWCRSCAGDDYVRRLVPDSRRVR